MTIDEVLRQEDVNLALHSTEKTGAVEEVLGLLRGDERVTDWQQLRTAVLERDAPALGVNGCGICIAHGRTASARELVMAAGRAGDGFACPETGERVRLIFVAGIPAAFSSEYLRMVGAIVRVCRDAKQLERLLAVKDGAAFVELLASAAERL